jgi:hypothetical protein
LFGIFLSNKRENPEIFLSQLGHLSFIGFRQILTLFNKISFVVNVFSFVVFYIGDFYVFYIEDFYVFYIEDFYVFYIDVIVFYKFDGFLHVTMFFNLIV